MSSLLKYLRKLYLIQDKIIVVHHPTLKSSWRDRTLYLSKDFNPNKEYNHRSILENELVIEFDEKEPKDNKKYADMVAHRLKADGFKVSKWHSGNKSTHIHTFIDFKECRNVSLLKNVMIRHYSIGLPLPDIRMSASNHLIRAEYGIHEKTKRKKKLISQSNPYPVVTKIPQIVWDKYHYQMSIIVQRKVTIETKNLVNHKGFNFIINSSTFREVDDGRERALFMLIHVLKDQYKEDKKGLTKFLQEWYRYSGGICLTPYQIECKINYHWKKNYNFGNKYINELLESLGRSDLCE